MEPTPLPWVHYTWWRIQGDRVIEFTPPGGVEHKLRLASTFNGRRWTAQRDHETSPFLGQGEGRSGVIHHGAYLTVPDFMAALSPWLEEACPHVLEVEFVKSELASLLAQVEEWDVAAALDGVYPGKGLALRYWQPESAHVDLFHRDLAAYYEREGQPTG